MGGFATYDKGGGVPGTTVYADNVDFTGVTRTNTITTNGQLLIGSTTANAGGNHINVGTITSPLGTLAIGYNSPNITLDVGGFNDLHTAKLIVNSIPNSGGNYTTITAALAAASPGDTIFVMPGSTGTYTENLTLKANVNITAFMGDSDTPHVTIIGNATLSAAGTVSIGNIRLQTNSAAFLTVSGSAASIVNLKNCYLNCTNSTGIVHSAASTGSVINIIDCKGDIGTTGIAIFTSTSTGTAGISASSMYFKNTEITNSGASTTSSTVSSSLVIFSKCKLFSPFTTSSVGSFGFYYTQTECANQNATTLTTVGTGAVTAQFSEFTGGSASAVSIGTGTTVTMTNSQVSSSNTNAITGAGTLNYSAIVFAGSSSGCNVTTQTPFSTGPALINTKQPAFSAYSSTNVTNQTGDGTSYTIVFGTELYDQANNFDGISTFTAPQTGRYHFSFNILSTGNTAANSLEGTLTIAGTSANVYKVDYGSSFTGNFSIPFSLDVPMTAGDTAVVKLIASNSTKTVGVYGAGGDPRTMFSGRLVA